MHPAGWVLAGCGLIAFLCLWWLWGLSIDPLVGDEPDPRLLVSVLAIPPLAAGAAAVFVWRMWSRR